MRRSKTILRDIIRYAVNREGRIKLVQDYIIPILSQEKWNEFFHPGPVEVEKSTYTLAKIYYENGNAAIISSIGILSVLLFLDILTQVNPIVYGLYLDLWAVIFFVRPSLMGPNVIATSVFDGYRDAKLRIEAQKMVFTNIGFFIFGVGFFLQILAVQFVSPAELITVNLVSISSIIVFIVLVLNLYVGFSLFNKTQSRYSVEE